MQRLKDFYINGAWIPANGTNSLEAINPSTEETYAILTLGNEQDANLAIKAATTAFSAWSQTRPEQRLDYILKMLEIYNSKAKELSIAISTEMGAPIDFALGAQVESGRRNIENFITAFKNFSFERSLDQTSTAKILLDPIGVVGLITPWNWPINQITKKVIPALLAGCTMVLKPSEIAPLSANIFAQICHEAQLPKGVFNMAHGTGREIGAAITSHSDIDMISFTGSTRAGREISQEAAQSLKHFTLELGGKGANIIFANSDENAISRGVLKCFSNSGQSCNAPTRMLIEKPLYKNGLEQAKAAAQKIKLDLSNKAGTHLGPVVSKLQYDRIQDLIASAIEEGAKLLIGGLGRAENLTKGYFVRPTIFADVTPNMRIFKEEIFGPVLAITPFETEEEAIKLANDTIYGLTNYIQSQDVEQCKRVAKALRSGMVEINGNALPNSSFFGGVKQSGRAREGAQWGIEEFLDTKAVTNIA